MSLTNKFKTWPVAKNLHIPARMRRFNDIHTPLGNIVPHMGTILPTSLQPLRLPVFNKVINDRL